MFRGLQIAQLRVIATLAIILFAGLAWRATQSPAPTGQSLQLQGNYTPHTPGEILSPGQATTAANAFAAGGLLDINVATAAELELLPGIGPAKAAAILEERHRSGPFSSLDDLDRRVQGIGEKMVERMRPLATTGPVTSPAPIPQSPATKPAPTTEPPTPRAQPPVRQPKPSLTREPAPPPTPNNAPVRINTASIEELERLIGIGPVLAQRIVADRARGGPYRSAKDLLRVKGIGPKTIEKNAHLIRYD